jgi:NADP-dependent 3-hydroxy acid dehydrogenase YdfG
MTCVVTGATGGIGKAIVEALVDEGAYVWAMGRDRGRLDALVASTTRDAVTSVVVDLSAVDKIERAAGAIAQAGDVDVLVHAAGAIRLGSSALLTAEDLDHLYAVNLRAPYVLTRELLPALRRRRGQVVFVNSSSASRPVAVNALYASTKAGLKALADGLRAEVNEDDVRVVSIIAGRTATAMQESVHAFEERVFDTEYLMSPHDVAGSVLHCLSLPRSAEVTDVEIRPMRKAP